MCLIPVYGKFRQGDHEFFLDCVVIRFIQRSHCFTLCTKHAGDCIVVVWVWHCASVKMFVFGGEGSSDF